MAKVDINIPKQAFLPVYRPLLANKDRTILLWGGRGSGKSQFAAQKLILASITEPYFRCILARKVGNTIKDSSMQTIMDILEEWGLDDYFEQKRSEIVCLLNGNKFIAKGLDDAKKIKSIRNPSHVWFEEANELTEQEYITVTSSVRGKKARYLQEILCFNPETEGNYTDFWIYKKWFKDIRHNSFRKKMVEKLEDGRIASRHVIALHTTHYDNPYLDDNYRALLEEFKTVSPFYYNVYTLGQWGNKKVENAFATQYDPKKHESTRAQFREDQKLRITMDFNLQPFAISFYHYWRDAEGEHLHFFDELSIENGDIYKAATLIKLKYGPYLPLCQLTGDHMGTRGEISQRAHKSLYDTLAKELQLKPRQIKTPPNPTHENSRMDVNYVLMYLTDFKINPKTCPNLCHDFRYVEVDAYGKIKKANRNNENQKSDALDTGRYAINTDLRPWIEKDLKRRLKLTKSSGIVHNLDLRKMTIDVGEKE